VREARHPPLSITSQPLPSVDLLYGLPDPVIASHGSISFTVNFVAIQEYFLSSGHCVISFPHSAPLDIALCSFGLHNSPLSYLPQTFYYGLSSVHVYDLFVVRDHLEDSISSASSAVPLSVIAQILSLGAWDCDILFQFESSLLFHLSPSQSASLSSSVRSILQFLQQNLTSILRSCLRPADASRVQAIFFTLGDALLSSSSLSLISSPQGSSVR
jgi:hypothetical protein